MTTLDDWITFNRDYLNGRRRQLCEGGPVFLNQICICANSIFLQLDPGCLDKDVHCTCYLWFNGKKRKTTVID